MSDGEPKRWILAREALSQVMASLGCDDWSAQRVLADSLESGDLTACASRITRNGAIGAAEFTDVEIPAFVWTGSFNATKDRQQWLWPTGNFIVTKGEPLFQETWKLYGVRFDGEQVDKLAPPLAPEVEPASAAPMPRKGVGGAPKKIDEWNAFWLAVVEIAASGRLTKTSFQTQAALREEVLLMIDNALSDKSIEPIVSQIWRRVIDRNG